MFERFTDRARRVLVLAQEEARLLNHNFIGTEHILLGLIHDGEGVAAEALKSLGVSLEAVREKVEETIHPGSASTGSPPFTPRAKTVLELSLREALQLGHNYIGTEHMLLGIVREGQGIAALVLVSLGADLDLVRRRVMERLAGDLPDPGLVGPSAGPVPMATGRGGWLRADRPEVQALTETRLGRLWRRATTIGPRANLDEPPLPEFTLSGDIALNHRDGRLAGTVAGQPVDMSLDVPKSRGRARGTFADDNVSASWQLGDNTTWHPAVPVSLNGTFAGHRALLFGWVPLDPPYHFDHASIDGHFAGQPVSAYLEEGDPGGDTGTFAAHGIFAASDFSLRGAVICGSRAVLEGAISGRPVRLQAQHDDGPHRAATLSGTFDGPAPLLLLLTGAVLFFM